MKTNLALISKFSLILALLFFTSGMALLKFFNAANTTANTDNTVSGKMPETVKQKQNPPFKKDLTETTANKPQLQTHFNSTEEIKKAYGRLEAVYLFNGREYTGVVLSVDSYYSIVTVDGLKNIPMNDVKMRVLLETEK